MSTYFNENHTPVDEFGHELFNDWDDLEWARFDNYIIECIKIYLNEGLIDMPTNNLAYRKIISDIGNECYQYFETLDRNDWLNIKKVYDGFLIAYPEKNKRFTQNKLTINVKKYAKYHNLEVDVRYSAGIGSLFIKGEQKQTEKKDDDIWDVVERENGI